MYRYVGIFNIVQIKVVGIGIVCFKIVNNFRINLVFSWLKSFKDIRIILVGKS